MCHKLKQMAEKTWIQFSNLEIENAIPLKKGASYANCRLCSKIIKARERDSHIQTHFPPVRYEGKDLTGEALTKKQKISSETKKSHETRANSFILSIKPLLPFLSDQWLMLLVPFNATFSELAEVLDQVKWVTYMYEGQFELPGDRIIYCNPLLSNEAFQKTFASELEEGSDGEILDLRV